MVSAYCLKRSILFSLLVMAGCGDKLPPIQTAPVKGRLTYRGQPVEAYRVCFFCKDGTATEPAVGTTAADGSFSLGVRYPGDGAIVGLNQVWFVYDPELPSDANPEALSQLPTPKVKLPTKYLAPETSGLEVEVPASGLSTYILDLK